MNARELVRLVHTTARFTPVGESSGRCLHSDAVVHAARQRRANGATLREVAATAGCSLSSAWRWTNGHRPAPARIVVKRVRQPLQTDEQSARLPRAIDAPGGHVGIQEGSHTPIGGAPTPPATPDLDFSELA